MIHLHLHSHYSVLDGLGKVNVIVARAKEINSPAVAITDHASISAMPELVKYSNECGIKPIVGCEFYIVDNIEPDKNEKRYHLLVLAKNWNGVQSIMRQLTLANKQFYKRPRLDWGQALEFSDCIISTACSSGLLIHNNYLELVDKFLDKYGDDFYLEIMPLSLDKGEEGAEGEDLQKIVNLRAIQLSEEKNIKLLATNDAHYAYKDDWEIHDVLLAIQSGKKLTDPTRWSFNTCDLYMKDTEEMIEAFKKLGYLTADKIKEAILSTYEVAKKVDIEIPEFQINLPNPFKEDDEVVFGKFIKDGWVKKITGVIPKTEQPIYLQRLEYEISVIKKLGFVRYFLIVADIIGWAREQGIMVGCGRGSAAGSLVCYLMDITQVDPIKFGLYFERFLNPERIDYPDIDVDFEDNRRDEVFEYIRKKYPYTSHINTFGYMKLKQAFQDVCRVHGINYIEAVSLSKKLESISDFETDVDLKKFATKYPKIIKQVERLNGTIRQCGVHAAGIIISDAPITDVSVLERRKDDVFVCNWDKRLCESFGLIKIDVLGLSTLSILNKAKKLIQERHDPDFTYEALPLDDKKTLEAFSKGEGVGVFQFENSGMRNLLEQITANSFETVTAATALFRPGSLHSGQTEKYIKIANGFEYEDYSISTMKPILEETKSIMVYQEQIMRIFVEIAGFSWAQADKMRKIISKSLGEKEFEKYRDEFLAGGLKKGYDKDVLNDLFNKMVKFAEYSFNKSHAVSYTMLSYWNMYIKVHYPVEFFAALFTHSGKDNKIKTYVNEAKKYGVNIILPDINKSSDEFYIYDDKTLVAPFGTIKGLGEKAIEEIINARKSVGVFVSKEHFLDNINKRIINKNRQDVLVRAGCFESLGIVETDKEIDIKNKSELIEIFEGMNTIKISPKKIDTDILNIFYKNIKSLLDAPVLIPKTGKSPLIMVINNTQKNEIENLTADGTKYLLKGFKQYLGLTPSKIYYTSYIKHVLDEDKQDELFKKYPSLYKDIIKKEIQLVKPDFIFCCVSSLVEMFYGEKIGIKDINGTITYNANFNCFVMFSVSPQWAFYQEEANKLFINNLKKLQEIIVFS